MTVPLSMLSDPVFGSANVNSLTSKIDDVHAFLAAHCFAGLAIQETKLCAKIDPSLLIIPNYELFRKDRKRNGGGVALFVRQSLRPQILRTGLARNLELVAVQGTLRSRRLLLASIYRPPNQSAAVYQSFLTDLQDWLASIGDYVHDLLLFGDFNICANSAEFPVLRDLFHTFNMTQWIIDSTHRDRTIDHIYVGANCTGTAGLGPTFEKSITSHSLTFLQLQ